MGHDRIESRDKLLAAFQKVDSGSLVEKLVDALLELQQLREEIRRLKGQVGSHSGNTSMPPSSDGPKTKAEQKKARAEARKRRKTGD
jgi:hypothetical protein